MNVGMDMCMNTVYTPIPGLPEVGMVWMGGESMMMHGEPTTHELMLDTRQTESPFFSHGSQPYDDLRNHIASTTMIRYVPQQFSTECSESDEAIENVDAHDIQQVSFISFTEDK